MNRHHSIDRSTYPSLWGFAVIGMLALAACTTSSTATSVASAEPRAASASSASAAPSGEPSDDAGPFACALPVNGVGSTAPAQLADVRIGAHEGYDRITFEFVQGIPQFSIDAATPPLLQDGSGLELEVDGNVFWQVLLQGGTKLSPEGGITYDGPTDFHAGYDKLVELREGGDFEAVSTWYVGLESESCIRVLILSAPSRLVIDIEH